VIRKAARLIWQDTWTLLVADFGMAAQVFTVAFEFVRGLQVPDPHRNACFAPDRKASSRALIWAFASYDIIRWMPKFVIEREIPGAGQMSAEEIRAAAEKSLSVLRDLGPEIQWLHSYITDNKVYCIYWAPNAEIIQEHARRCGAPANRISAVRRLMEPADVEAS